MGLVVSFKKKSGLRDTYSLNQLWEFAPVDGKPEAAPSSWGYFIVPGHWRGGNISNFMLSSQGSRLTAWKDKSVGDYKQAWYRRTIKVPTAWKDKAVVLQFEHIKGFATLYVNGTEAGHSTLASGGMEFSVGALLKPGTENEIKVLVKMSAEATDQRTGIFGDVWLTVLPVMNFGNPQITTSFRQKQLALQVKAVKGAAIIELSILDGGKKIAGKAWSADASGKYLYEWMPATLWTPETPKLYDAEISMRSTDGQVLDSATVRFGFREFWIEKGDFILNGQKLILKADSALPNEWSSSWVFNDNVFRSEVAFAKQMNLNAFLMPQETPARLYDIADEEGILVLQKGLIRSHEERDMADSNPAWWEGFEQEAQNTLGSPVYKNHPSIICWVIDVWYNFHSGTATPGFIGMRSEPGSRLMPDSTGKMERKENVIDPNIGQGIPKLRKAHLDRVVELCRKYAPEFEYMTNGSGHVGNVFSTHIYHTWGAPRSELRTLFERWKAEKELPVYAGEISEPYIISFYDLEKAQNGGTPYFLENGARLFGNESYCYDGVYTLKPFHDLTDEGVFANRKETSPGKPPVYFLPDVVLDAMADYTGSLYPAWRADGFSGFGTFAYVRESHWVSAGVSPANIQSRPPVSLSQPGYTPQTFGRGDAMTLPGNPFDPTQEFRENIVAPPFRRALSNLSLILAGPIEDPYLEDHSFYAKEKVSKTAVVANDTSKAVTIHLQASLLNANGRQLQKQEFDLSIKAGEQGRQPVTFEMPSVTGREEFHLEFRLFNGKQPPQIEQINMEVFPRNLPPWADVRLQVFDPEGILRKKLDTMGARYELLKNLKGAVAGGVLIIGRNALASTTESFDPNEFTQRGINVLILEQKDEVSPELIKVRQREVYLESPGHPILTGLKDADFKNWSGAYGNSPAYAPTQPGLWWSDWGNRNVVATYVLRRPYMGNYITLLASGFDLYQTPLIECRGATASWIACQLDLTDRLGSSPVPTLLFQRMVGYLISNGKNLGASASFSRSTESDFLGKLRIAAESVSAPNAETLSKYRTIVISNVDFEGLRKYQKDLADFVYWGGKIIYLHNQKNFDSCWLPFPISVKTENIRQALIRNPVWNMGWHNNDLYWHDKFNVPVFSGFPSQFDATDPAVVVRRKFGSGEYWFVSITPDLFANTLATAKTTRLISAILVQNGVSILQQENPYCSKDDGIKFDMTNMKWEFKTDPEKIGIKEGWERNYNPSGWLKGLIADGVEVRVGVPWESFLKVDYDGVAWYRLSFQFPSGFPATKDLYLNMGPIDDFDQVYFNGQKIGETGRETPKWWDKERVYKVPANLIKTDTANMIAVRVEDEGGIGGIKKGPVTITTTPPRVNKVWSLPYPGSNDRDYIYKPDVVRMY